MKRLATLLVLIVTVNGYSQGVKQSTKIDAFTYEKGRVIKFVDVNLPVLKTTYDNCDTRIRTFIRDGKQSYFYQIVKEGKDGVVTASIEYSDLFEIFYAIVSLRGDIDEDIARNPDYLENKFISNDGFQVGYYVRGAKATWFLKLERDVSDNTVYMNDANTIQVAFATARVKIDELKGKK